MGSMPRVHKRQAVSVSSVTDAASRPVGGTSDEHRSSMAVTVQVPPTR
ncbi:hypothetical protein [Streptomyces sp. NPDC005302]